VEALPGTALQPDAMWLRKVPDFLSSLSPLVQFIYMSTATGSSKFGVQFLAGVRHLIRGSCDVLKRGIIQDLNIVCHCMAFSC